MKVSRLKPNPAGIVEWPMLSTTRGSVLTVGEFDGVHRGHQALLKRVVDLAAESDSTSVAIMFDPSPKRVHLYAADHVMADLPDGLLGYDPEEVMGVDERIRLMEDLGLDRALVVHYTLAFAAKSYRFFIRQLVDKLGMQTLVLGRDARMGSGRAGDVTAIGNLAEETGMFRLDLVDDRGPGYVSLDGQASGPARGGSGERGESTPAGHRKIRAWSTSNLRHLLARGRVREAGVILGRPHSVEGEVVHGEQRGRGLGFPTANLSREHSGYMPMDGVYAGWLVDMGPYRAAGGGDGKAVPPRDSSMGLDLHVRLAPGSPWRMPAAISIGTKETFLPEGGRAERVLEANVITADWLELYGHRVRIEFLDFLRLQERYAGAEELKTQMALDAGRAKALTDQAAKGIQAA